MDYDETPLTRRIPSDTFEIAVFRRLLQDEVRGWPTTRYQASIGDYQGDGTWALFLRVIEDAPNDAAPDALDLSTVTLDDILDVSALPPVHMGRIWLAERESPASEYLRVVMRWELETTDIAGHRYANDTEYPPRIEMF